MHIGETDIAAAKTVREFLMVQSEKMEDCGVEIEYLRNIFH